MSYCVTHSTTYLDWDKESVLTSSSVLWQCSGSNHCTSGVNQKKNVLSLCKILILYQKKNFVLIVMISLQVSWKVTLQENLVPTRCSTPFKLLFRGFTCGPWKVVNIHLVLETPFFLFSSAELMGFWPPLQPNPINEVLYCKNYNSFFYVNMIKFSPSMCIRCIVCV